MTREERITAAVEAQVTKARAQWEPPKNGADRKAQDQTADMLKEMYRPEAEAYYDFFVGAEPEGENDLDATLAKLDSFAELSDGWLDKGSVAIRPEAIEDAKTFLRVTTGVVPGVAPTSDGGVTFEWPNWENDNWVSMDFSGDPDNGSLHFEFR